MLTPVRGLIFRITHRENVPHLLQHGVHCRSSDEVNPDFIEIGQRDIIGTRKDRVVPAPPGGTVADYVPFYFTPRSPMLHNILTGRNGVKLRSASEIVVLVSSLLKLEENGRQFVLADRNACLAHTTFEPGRDLLTSLPWTDLQTSDYRRDLNRPDKLERYMAEALVHHHLPTDALLGIITYDRPAQLLVDQMVSASGVSLKTSVMPSWYP
ncbi:MAG TPA: DUF4433 domain-containing protein [Gemmatimonadales bacterium]